MNLASAVYGALASGATAWVAAALVESTRRGLFSGLLIGFSYTFWSQSIIAEVYALHLLMIAASLAALLAWSRRPTTVPIVDVLRRLRARLRQPHEHDPAAARVRAARAVRRRARAPRGLAATASWRWPSSSPHWPHSSMAGTSEGLWSLDLPASRACATRSAGSGSTSRRPTGESRSSSGWIAHRDLPIVSGCTGSTSDSSSAGWAS